MYQLCLTYSYHGRRRKRDIKVSSSLKVGCVAAARGPATCAEVEGWRSPPLEQSPTPSPGSRPPLVSEETNDTFRYLIPLPYTWRPRRAAAAEHTLLPLPPSFFSLSTGPPTCLPACLPSPAPCQKLYLDLDTGKQDTAYENYKKQFSLDDVQISMVCVYLVLRNQVYRISMVVCIL